MIPTETLVGRESRLSCNNWDVRTFEATIVAFSSVTLEAIAKFSEFGVDFIVCDRTSSKFTNTALGKLGSHVGYELCEQRWALRSETTQIRATARELFARVEIFVGHERVYRNCQSWRNQS